jgi:toxin ParE1/3/4
MAGKPTRDDFLLTQGAEQELESIHGHIAEVDSVANANHLLDQLINVVDGRRDMHSVLARRLLGA